MNFKSLVSTLSPSAAPGSRHGIAAAGHWLVDHVKRIDHWPQPATLARIQGQQMANGGFAFNVLVDLAALDEDCPLYAAGLIGDDANGRFIRERCRHLGINDTFLHTLADQPTGYTDVMTEANSGRRTFFYCAGANARFTENHVEPAALTAKIFCLGYLGFLPNLDDTGIDGLTGSARLLRAASAAGMITAADLVSAPNPDLAAQVTSCLPHLDLLFLNEWEAGQLLQVPVPERLSAKLARELARAVRQLGVRGAVVVHSPEGVAAALPDDECFTQGSVRLPPESIEGTVGAGDALAAGILLARHHDMPWPEALTLGVCTAAACLQSPAASDGVRAWKQNLALGLHHGYHEFA